MLDGGNAPAAPPTAAEVKGDHLGERILSSGNGQRENADFGNHSRLTSQPQFLMQIMEENNRAKNPEKSNQVGVLDSIQEMPMEGQQLNDIN